MVDDEIGTTEMSEPARIEVKLAFNPSDTASALHALGFDNPIESNAPKIEHPDEAKWVYFFDTINLALIDRGLILRLRQTATGVDRDDATLKVRGPSAPDAARRFLAAAGDSAKYEGDQNVGQPEKPSLSISAQINRGTATNVVTRMQSLTSVLHEAAETLLNELIVAELQDQIRCFGPIRSRIWHWKPKGFAGKITAELWEVGERSLLEISDKSPRADALALGKQLKNLVPKAKARQLDDSKTRFALDILAKQSANI